MTAPQFADPTVLFSTNTWLAWAIAERFYRGVHYCWCAPFFDGRSAPRSLPLPPSASPAELYATIAGEVKRGDRHSSSIARNRVGVLRGAAEKRKSGVITRRQEQEIVTIVADAAASDFRPLLFVVPYELVKRRVAVVPAKERSHPLSPEYIIRSLPNRFFQVIELEYIS